MTLPRATVRLQVHRDFSFDAARAQVPYFARLGISHLYTSPILTARSGSQHGYDVVDHGFVNPELGGEKALRMLVAELRRHDMGLIVDSVPNHMAVGGHENRAWLDLLEWGPDSRFANFFDVDWDVPDPALRRRVHAPFLGGPYGEILAAGELTLNFDDEGGRFRFQYYEHHFPMAPRTYPQLMRLAGPALADYERRFREALTLPRARRGDDFSQVCRALAAETRRQPAVADALQRLTARADGRSAEGFALLHGLLQRQHYRLAWWRTAADEINWRRFFDIIDLAGVRIQETTAFEVAHATLFRLYAEGLIDGLRVDHVDGLADPCSYCRDLRRRLTRLTRERPPEAPGGPPYILVEKILAPGERLATDWEVDGTTGYSYMNEVGALLHAPEGEAPLVALWTELSGRHGDFEAEEKAARRRIPKQLLGADFNACAHALHAVARRRPETRDWTLFAIRRVLTELLVQFPVYRTYADARGRSDADEAIMAHTVAAAAPHCDPGDRPLLEHISRWLGGEAPMHQPAGERRARLRAIARFQQLSSPVAAKSVEDTAFYRYGLLLSRNEVGASPDQFAFTAGQYHEEAVHRWQLFPRAMLTTATHDHKRGEDLRARLALLSEVPGRWAETVHHWRQLNGGFKQIREGEAWPDTADEYMLYQMLVGAWPPDLALEDTDGIAALRERLTEWQLKALRESKRHSNWYQPNTDYEAAAQAFLARLLDPGANDLFLPELYQFVQSLAAAGAVNGLTQTALRLTSPGVPDLYQGCEFWDFSLVDPDNRRPVDYAARAEALAAETEPATLLENWRDGRVKLDLIARLLELRRRRPRLFTVGEYLPLPVGGEAAPHLLAYARSQPGGGAMVVAVPLYPMALTEYDRPHIDPARWEDTALALPPELAERSWRSVLDGRELNPGGSIMAAELFGDATVAVLETG